MKKIALAVSVLAASAAGASAADLPLKAKPIVAAGLDWSGVYIGAHAGYGGGMKDWDAQADFPADFVARGPLVGGQVGINKQLGSFVFGLELDGSWADIKGSGSQAFGGLPLPFSINTTATSKIDSIATFAGRAGIAADRWFVFAKAGLSAAHEEHSLRDTLNLPTLALNQTTALSGSETRYAPMLGFGAEYALSGPWSIFAEYNYHHFGARNVRLTGSFTSIAGVATPVVYDTRIDQSIHVAKLGVNYRLGNFVPSPSFAPVPAAPGTNWTGGYIGAQGGYGWGRTQWPDLFGVVEPGGSLPRFDHSGWLAGGTIGVNAQSGRFVFGVEGEMLATGMKGNFSSVTDFGGGDVISSTLSSKIDWLALATARAGFVVGDRLMLYGKGGIAIAEEQHTAAATQSPVSTNYTGKAVHTGAVVGVGAEYAFAPNWSVKAEYDYIKMFAQQVQLNGTLAGGILGAGISVRDVASITQDLHLVKFGVNYHFSPQPLVVARY